MRKKPAVVVPAAPEPKPVIVPPQPFWRSVMTDHNGDFDLGALLTGVVIAFMCALEGYDVWRGKPFNAQTFGFGIAAVLGGFAAYKWGDSKRPPPSTTPTQGA